jgi:hypothetical protein
MCSEVLDTVLPILSIGLMMMSSYLPELKLSVTDNRWDVFV